MAIITRSKTGEVIDRGETLSEFRSRMQKERIARRGLTKTEKRRQERAKKEAEKISAGFSIEELSTAGEKSSDISVIKRKSGERIYVKRGASLKLEKPKGTKLVTKADGSQVFQRIIKTSQGTIIEETKAYPSFFGRGGKITEARISQRVTAKPKQTPTDYSVIDEFTGIDEAEAKKTKKLVSFGKKGIDVTPTKTKKAKKFIRRETSKILAIPEVKQRLQSVKESAKIVDDVSKFFVDKLGIKAGFKVVRKFVEFVGDKNSKIQETNLKVLGFSDKEAKDLVKRQKEINKNYGSGLLLDIGQDIIDEPAKNAALFFAAAGFSKGVKVVSKGVNNLAAKGFSNTAKAVKTAGVLGGGALTVAYAQDVINKVSSELANFGTIRGTTRETLRELAIFSAGARFGGKLTKAEKVKLAQYNRLKARLSKKDLAKLNRLSAKAKKEYFLVERLEGLKRVSVRQAKGKRGTLKEISVKEVSTKLTKAKKKPKVAKKIKLKGYGEKISSISEKKLGVSTKKGLKVDAVLKDGKLIITDKTILKGKGKKVKFKFEKYDANAFKKVEVTRTGKIKDLDILQVTVSKSGKLKIKPTKTKVKTKIKPKTFTRRAPRKEVLPIKETRTEVIKNVNVRGKIKDVEIIAFKPVKTSKIKKAPKIKKVPKKISQVFNLDSLFLAVGKKQRNILSDLAKKSPKTKLTKPKKVKVSGGLVAKTTQKQVSKSASKPILAAISAIEPKASFTLVPFTTTKQGSSILIKPRIRTPQKPIIISDTRKSLKVSKRPVTKVSPIIKPRSDSKPKSKTGQAQEPIQELEPVLTVSQKPKLQVEQKLKFRNFTSLKTFKKQKVLPIPFIELESKTKPKKSKSFVSSKQITFFTPTIVGDVKRRKKEEELPFFSGLEVRP